MNWLHATISMEEIIGNGESEVTQIGVEENNESRKTLMG